MIYFTSDLHIGHDRDFIWKERGFSSVEKHNEEILKRWNEVVKPEVRMKQHGIMFFLI